MALKVSSRGGPTNWARSEADQLSYPREVNDFQRWAKMVDLLKIGHFRYLLSIESIDIALDWDLCEYIANGLEIQHMSWKIPAAGR